MDIVLSSVLNSVRSFDCIVALLTVSILYDLCLA